MRSLPCRVLLTTIPKCGKNLLVSFFSALGLTRQVDEGDLAMAASHAQARWLLSDQAGQIGGHSVGDLVGFLSDTSAMFDRVLNSFDSLPDGSFVQGHFAYDPELHQRAREAGVTVVFLYRDPRGCVTSMAHFLLERGEPASLVPHLPSHDLAAALQLLIHGNEVNAPFASVYAPYEGWRRAEDVVQVRFEDVVGPRGNGSMLMQSGTLTSLADDIGWSGSRTELLHGILGAFEPRAGTFRRGTLDSWRDDVTGIVDAPAWEDVQSLARAWGYGDEPTVCTGRGVDEALTALLGGLHAEHQLEAAEQERTALQLLRRDRTIVHLEGRVAEQRVRPRHLAGLVAQLGSRAVLRLADRAGRLASHVTSRLP